MGEFKEFKEFNGVKDNSLVIWFGMFSGPKHTSFNSFNSLNSFNSPNLNS